MGLAKEDIPSLAKNREIALPLVFTEEAIIEGYDIFLGPGIVSFVCSRAPDKNRSNEDALLICPCGKNSCVVAVADGVGGGRAGHKASALAVQSMEESLQKAGLDETDLRGRILDGFELANEKILELGIGAATTMSVVEVNQNILRSYHAGDSETLVVGQKGKLKFQSVSHSPVGAGVEHGFIDEKDAIKHEERHIVSNVLGSTDMRIELSSSIELDPKDSVLVASDGLTDNLTVDEIVETIRSGPLDESTRALHKTAQERMEKPRGSLPSKPDDFTAVLFRLAS